MIFSWRQMRGNRRRGTEKNENFGLELTIPNHFRCPISLDLMKDPVTLSTGITYDRENIEKWIEDGNQTCPVTNQVLRSFDQIPNHSIRKMIQDWCVENKSFGIERIPTPRIPVTPHEVSEISLRIIAAIESGDARKCQELVEKIKVLARESERNKKCIKENGVGYALAASFEAFSSKKNEGLLLKNLLSSLTWMFPLGVEGLLKIGSSKSLSSTAWFLNDEDLSSRQHAIIVLKELLSNSTVDSQTRNSEDQCSNSNNLRKYALDTLVEIEGVPEALFKMIKVPIYPKATKACLMVIYHMLSFTTSDKIISKFLDMGLVSLLIEMIVDAKNNISEKALGVLDRVCNWQEGKVMVRQNALAIPLIVKKILRVSPLETEFSISILWKLCKDGHENEDQLIEAVQVGGFQKLLVVLQVGCSEKTRVKTTELLKLMNIYKDRVKCFDSSSGFKYLKRSY